MKQPPEQLGVVTAESVSSDDYEALLSALNQTALVSMTDARGRITYANDKFVEVSGYTRPELLGQNHRILKSGQQPDSLFEDLWKTISKGKVWRGEIQNRAKSGSYYWVDTSIAPIIGENGKPRQYIAVRFLITEAKQARVTLEEQNLQLEKFNNILVGRELKMVELKAELAHLKGRADAV
jgi:PAS domain S-box-containing protein